MSKSQSNPIRLHLERQLIGGAVFSPFNALVISDMLRPQNFSDIICGRLMTVIGELVPKGEFTQMDIHSIYMKSYQDYAAYHITDLMDGYMGGFVEPMALELIQMDMREKFCAMMQGCEAQYAKQQQFEIAGVFKDCRNHFEHPDTDMLKAIPNIYSYLKQYVPDDLDEYGTLMEALPKVMDRIKKKGRTRKFLHTLQSLAEGAHNHEQKQCLTILSELIIIALSGAKMSDEFLSHLTQLKNSL